MAKHMDISEFRSEGYLQEVNRLFFHPLGLALEVTVDAEGVEVLSGVWDYRDDPEGIFYDGNVLEASKADKIDQLVAERRDERRDALGYWIQPVEGEE